MTTARSRRGAGKSEWSYEKHEIIAPLVRARTAIMATFKGRYAVIDLTAGDGFGVASRQLSIDGLPDESKPTARMAIEAAIRAKGRADAILCELDPVRLERLRDVARRHAGRAPIEVLGDNRLLLERIVRRQYETVLVINDVCGPTEHPMDVLRHIGRCVPMADFALIHNEFFFQRWYSGDWPDRIEAGDTTIPKGNRTIWERYGWQWLRSPANRTDYAEWMRRLGKRRCMFWPRTVVDSDNFHGRVALYTNFMEPRHIPAGWLACGL